jgi:hypothetical protein
MSQPLRTVGWAVVGHGDHRVVHIDVAAVVTVAANRLSGALQPAGQQHASI